MSRTLPIPERARDILANEIPSQFVDDGCSNSPDAIFGFNFKWACRIHDWRYCSRCHAAGHMNQSDRRFADRELGSNLREALPWIWRWTAWIYRSTVRRHGGRSAWNSCGPSSGNACRHEIAPPEWMTI